MSTVMLVVIVGAVSAILLMGIGLIVEMRARRKRARAQTDSVTLMTAQDHPDNASGRGQTIFLIVPLAIAGIGMVVLFLALRWWFEYHDSKNWSTTPGTVTTSRLEEDYDSDDGYKYKVEVKYKYTVDKKTYTNDRVFFNFESEIGFDRIYDLRSDAERVTARYPTGKTVTVLYDPDDPRQAVLERRFDQAPFLYALGGGLLVVVIGLGGVIFGLVELSTGKEFSV
jgi:hypothetical protein